MVGAEILVSGWFHHTRHPYKTKGLALRVSYACLHPYLRSDATTTNAYVSCLRISVAVELASIHPHLQWIRGAVLTSPSSLWRVLSIAVLSRGVAAAQQEGFAITARWLHSVVCLLP